MIVESLVLISLVCVFVFALCKIFSGAYRPVTRKGQFWNHINKTFRSEKSNIQTKSFYRKNSKHNLTKFHAVHSDRQLEHVEAMWEEIK